MLSLQASPAGQIGTIAERFIKPSRDDKNGLLCNLGFIILARLWDWRISRYFNHFFFLLHFPSSEMVVVGGQHDRTFTG